jgi:peptidoglycan/LPS O-acetylase OafA/YrhL
MNVPPSSEPVAPNVPLAGAATRPGRTVPAAPRIAALDGLRGIAVLLVVVMHYYSVVPTPPDSAMHDLLRRASSLFFCGVDLFFVLSGFFIGGILIDNRDSSRLLPAFYLRRFLRIVPLYFLLIGSVLIGRHIAGLNSIYHGAYFTSSLPDWTYFTFTQNIAMAWQRTMGPHWLSVTWSLAIEEQFYLLLPLLVLWLNRRHLAIACLGLIALSPLLRTAALLAPNEFAAVFLLPMRADGLLCGVLCAIIARSPEATAIFRQHRRLAVLAVAMLTVAIPLFSLERWGAASRPVGTIGYTLLSAYFAVILLLVLTGPETRLAAALSFRPLAAIGVTSYFIYLFHRPIWYTLHWLVFRTPPSHFTLQAGAITCLALAATLGAAAVSWRWLETPLLRLARRFPYR